jgi:hypothetical protein
MCAGSINHGLAEVFIAPLAAFITGCTHVLELGREGALALTILLTCRRLQFLDELLLFT